MKYFSLFYAAVVSKYISARLTSHMIFDSSATHRKMIVGNGMNSGCKEVFIEISIAFLHHEAKLNFSTIDIVAVNFSIVLSDLEWMQATLDIGGQFSGFMISNEFV